MADIQATQEIVKWTVNGITILLMVIAASIALKKKNNICFFVALVGNLAVYYFTKSPLLCMIISVVCIIWALVQKRRDTVKPDLKVLKSSVKTKETKEKSESVTEKKIKCRFCNKSYSSEYNGCPYCKKV